MTPRYQCIETKESSSKSMDRSIPWIIWGFSDINTRCIESRQWPKHFRRLDRIYPQHHRSSHVGIFFRLVILNPIIHSIENMLCSILVKESRGTTAVDVWLVDKLLRRHLVYLPVAGDSLRAECWSGNPLHVLNTLYKHSIHVIITLE